MPAIHPRLSSSSQLNWDEMEIISQRDYPTLRQVRDLECHLQEVSRNLEVCLSMQDTLNQFPRAGQLMSRLANHRILLAYPRLNKLIARCLLLVSHTYPGTKQKLGHPQRWCIRRLEESLQLQTLSRDTVSDFVRIGPAFNISHQKLCEIASGAMLESMARSLADTPLDNVDWDKLSLKILPLSKDQNMLPITDKILAGICSIPSQTQFDSVDSWTRSPLPDLVEFVFFDTDGDFANSTDPLSFLSPHTKSLLCTFHPETLINVTLDFMIQLHSSSSSESSQQIQNRLQSSPMSHALALANISTIRRDLMMEALQACLRDLEALSDSYFNLCFIARSVFFRIISIFS